MDKEFIAILQKLITEQGKETLFNSSKCKAFLADYTRGEYKKESRLLLQALEAGVQKAIDTAENITICKKQQIRLLHDDYSLDEKLAAEVVDTLALVLRGDISKSKDDTLLGSGEKKVTKKSVVKKPVAKKASAKKTTVKKTVSKKPTAKKTMINAEPKTQEMKISDLQESVLEKKKREQDERDAQADYIAGGYKRLQNPPDRRIHELFNMAKAIIGIQYGDPEAHDKILEARGKFDKLYDKWKEERKKIAED